MSDASKTVFFCCLLLIAAGCTTVSKPLVKNPLPKTTVKSHADVSPVKPDVPKPAAAESSAALPSLAERYLMELSEVQAMSAEQSRRELNELNTAKRLDKIKRFRLAAVLTREEHGDWERALKMLEGLTNDDPRSQALTDLLRKSLRTQIELRQQDARVIELQQRIEQIKTLEKDLHQRNETP